jgi:hypothetical protein
LSRALAVSAASTAKIDGTDKLAIAVRREAHLRNFMRDLRGLVSDVERIPRVKTESLTSAA